MDTLSIATKAGTVIDLEYLGKRQKNLSMKPLTERERETLESFINENASQPYKYFEPNGAATDYIEAIGDMYESKKRIFVFCAANGVSKTTTGLNIWANIIWPNVNPYFKGASYSKKWTWPKHIWLITDDSAVKDVFDNPEVGFDRWWPKGRFKKKYDDGRLSKIETDNGWVLTVKTVDQGLRKFESSTIGGLWYDEPVFHRLHKACARGLRRGGVIFNMATPLESAEWQIDHWYENEDVQKYLYIREACLWENVKDAEWTDPETGKKHKSVRGFLSQEDAELVISQYDDEEFSARVWGKHKELQGRVLKEFKPEAPYVIPFEDKYLSMQIYRVIDPHDRRFPAVGWYAVDANDDYYVVYEWPNIDAFKGKLYFQLGDLDRDIEGICKVILDIEKEMPNLVYSWMDPNFGAKPYANSGLTVQEEFEQYGVYTDVDVLDGLFVGHSKLRQLLKTDNLTKTPRLRILDNCNNHIWAFKRYRYANDQKKKSTESQHKSEKVSDFAKDFVDTTRYFVINDIKFNHKIVEKGGWRSRLASGKRGLFKH